MTGRVVRRDDQHSLQSSADSPREIKFLSLAEAKNGTPLARSIYDDNGVMLIVQGTRLTDDLKRQLLLRGILDVPLVVPVSGPRPHNPMLQAVKAPSSSVWDPDLTRYLKRQIESRLTLVNNLGPSAQIQLQHHGTQNYARSHLAEIQNLHSTAVRILHSQMWQVHQGAQIDASFLERLAELYLRHLLTDMDGCLTAPITTHSRRELAVHAIQFSMLAMAMAIHLGMNNRNVTRIGVTAMVHDWGWLRVDHALWFRTRNLDPLEEMEVKRHPLYTSSFLERMWGLPALVARISHQVHEKLDGSGYPRGDQDRHIHQFARILHIANEYLELTSPRADEPLIPYNATEQLLRESANGRIDGLILRGFLRAMSVFPLGSYVSLSDGSVARVLRANGDFYTTPIVQRLIKEDPETGERHHFNARTGIIDLLQSDIKIVQALPSPRRIHPPVPAPHFVSPATARRSERRSAPAQKTPPPHETVES